MINRYKFVILDLRSAWYAFPMHVQTTYNYSIGCIIGGLGYPGDLAGWLLHALTPKHDKKKYYAHHLQPKVVLLTSIGFEVCTNEVFSD